MPPGFTLVPAGKTTNHVPKGRFHILKLEKRYGIKDPSPQVVVLVSEIIEPLPYSPIGDSDPIAIKAAEPEPYAVTIDRFPARFRCSHSLTLRPASLRHFRIVLRSDSREFHSFSSPTYASTSSCVRASFSFWTAPAPRRPQLGPEAGLEVPPPSRRILLACATEQRACQPCGHS